MRSIAPFLAGAVLLVAAPAVAQPEQQVELAASRPKVVYGDALLLTGSVDATACGDGVDVAIEFDQRDDLLEGWVTVGHAHTQEDGSFSEVVLPQNSGVYRASVADEPGPCAAATSEEVGVGVRVKVGLEAARRSVTRGSTAPLTVRVEPLCHREAAPPLTVRLFRFRNGGFVRVATQPVDDDCTVTFERRIRRTTVFQARFPAIDGLHWAYDRGRSPLEVVGIDR